jgi:hypothetical protein
MFSYINHRESENMNTIWSDPAFWDIWRLKSSGQGPAKGIMRSISLTDGSQIPSGPDGHLPLQKLVISLEAMEDNMSASSLNVGTTPWIYYAVGNLAYFIQPRARQCIVWLQFLQVVPDDSRIYVPAFQRFRNEQTWFQQS